MTDDPSDELPPEFQALLDQHARTAHNPYSIFKEVIDQYHRNLDDLPRIPIDRITEVDAQIRKNGQLQDEINGKKILWAKGLASLCSCELETNVGAAAYEHDEALLRLYRIWDDFDASTLVTGQYQANRRATLNKLLEVELAPDLYIVDRARLSPEYVDVVLKPYHRAVEECRKLLWARLRKGHEEGLWLCYQPDGQGGYTLLQTGAGFDNKRSYAINRAAYLKGFNRGEHEVGHQNYWHSEGYVSQDSWVFVGADQLEGVWTIKSHTELNRIRKEATRCMELAAAAVTKTGKRASSEQLKELAREKFQLTKNAVNDAWKDCNIPDKGKLGKIASDKKIPLNDIKELIRKAGLF